MKTIYKPLRLPSSKNLSLYTRYINNKNNDTLIELEEEKLLLYLGTIEQEIHVQSWVDSLKNKLIS